MASGSTFSFTSNLIWVIIVANQCVSTKKAAKSQSVFLLCAREQSVKAISNANLHAFQWPLYAD